MSYCQTPVISANIIIRGLLIECGRILYNLWIGKPWDYKYKKIELIE
jgi:hypothetical protein